MVQWGQPATQARLDLINTNITYLLLGLYGWEYFQTLHVEYAVIRGRLTFRWPLIPYVVARLFLFIFLILLTIKLSPSSHLLKCQSGAVTVATTGNIALVASSTNFMIRTWLIWKNSRVVHALLLALALGHGIILALDIANLEPIKSHTRGCAVYIAHPSMIAAVFVYSLGYDFIILVLSIVGLSRERSKSPLGKRLRAQGIVYFVVTVITYIAPTVFAFLGISLMGSITGLCAITASTIASCRAVRSLLGARAPSESGQTTEESVENDVALTSQIPVHTTTPGSGVV